ncbi:guanine nucleotide binding protein, alpha subunit [Entophlyctis helioformis]|nr:guanine nucleotide binding protein, alpha subunit [Entophlyctis helioformis]
MAESTALTDKDRQRISKEIDAKIASDKESLEKSKNEPRILLLGSGDSGKTTFLKQLRLVHGQPFDDVERAAYKKSILVNVADAVLMLFDAAASMGVSNFDDETKGYITSIIEHFRFGVEPSISSGLGNSTAGGAGIPSSATEASISGLTGGLNASPSVNFMAPDSMTLTPEIAKAIKTVWHDPTFQKVYSERGKMLQDTAPYFLEKVEEFTQANYMPTDEDILNTRVMTTQVTETIINVKQMRFHVFDVGGQIKHRKQWIPFFDNVHNILFITSLASYDQTLVEDPSVNRMQDALVLFGEVVNNQLLASIPVILFLNKKDLFEKKIKTSNIKTYFPGYQPANGGVQDLKGAVKFFGNQFLAQNKNPEKGVYVHITCCTDSKAMKKIIASVTDSLMHQAMSGWL